MRSPVDLRLFLISATICFELLIILALISFRFLLARHAPVTRNTARDLASPLRMSLGVCPKRHSGRMQHLLAADNTKRLVILKIFQFFLGYS
jgi:hypothetical protein